MQFHDDVIDNHNQTSLFMESFPINQGTPECLYYLGGGGGGRGRLPLLAYNQEYIIKEKSVELPI